MLRETRAISLKSLYSNLAHCKFEKVKLGQSEMKETNADFGPLELARKLGMRMLRISVSGVDNTAKTRRPQPRSNTKNDRVPSASRVSCIKNKEHEGGSKHMDRETEASQSFVLEVFGKLVYFVEGLGHNLFLVGQFCDSDLEVAFRRNSCFVRNLDGVDLLKGNRSTNLYTINLHEM
ncbi:hypothetical protein Tco_1410118 [Tanacetum coccineum]